MNTSRLKIKVCGLKINDNILAVDELNVDYIGMIFYDKSKRFIQDIPSALQQIKATKVGVFVNASIQEISEAKTKFQLSIAQLHGNETPDFCNQIQKLGLKVWKVYGIDNKFEFSIMDDYIESVDAFLLDTKSSKHGGTGVKFNWDLLNKINPTYPFFLSGGISPEDLSVIKRINMPNLIGLDLNSRFEIEPGLKNIPTLKQFISDLKKT